MQAGQAPKHVTNRQPAVAKSYLEHSRGSEAASLNNAGHLIAGARDLAGQELGLSGAQGSTRNRTSCPVFSNIFVKFGAV